MARIRTIKPEFWVDEKVVELTPWARLLFIGLWNFTDDQGYIDDKPVRLKMQVFPGDSVNISELVSELVNAGLLDRYESPVGPVLKVRNWERHQRVDKPGKPRFPADSVKPREDSRNPRESSPAEGKGREGKGAIRPSVERAAPPARPLHDTDATAQTLIGEYLEKCSKRPPAQVIGQLGKTIKAMLSEGIEPADIRGGLQEWSAKALHPSTLPSVVNDVMNRPTGRHLAAVNGRQTHQPYRDPEDPATAYTQGL